MGAFKRQYKNKDGKIVTAENWTVEFFIDGQRFCRSVDGTSALTQKEADRLCDDLKEQKKAELKGTAKNVTYDDAMLAFYENYTLDLDRRRKEAPHKIIKDAYLPIIEKNLTPHFTGKDLTGIKRADIADFILKRRRTGIKDKTIKNDVLCLSSMFTFCESAGLCEDKDIPNFKKIFETLAKSKPKTAYLSTDEFDRLVFVIKQNSRLWNVQFFVEFSVETGLRQEEMLSLRWLDFDFAARKVNVRDTKNGKDRKVPLSQRAYDLAKQQLHKQQHKKLTTDYVISHEDGSRYIWVEGQFKKACADAKINYSIHDLRRTFGSWRLQGIRGRKCDLKEVSMMLGHSSTQITEQAYAFLKEEEITL